MFDKIGSKLKDTAQVLTWFGIVGSVIAGVVLLFVSHAIIGIATAISGSLISWLSSLALYGLGQLIENTDALVANSKKQNSTPNAVPSDYMRRKAVIDKQESENGKTHKWRCSNCGNLISESVCPYCNNDTQN